MPKNLTTDQTNDEAPLPVFSTIDQPDDDLNLDRTTAIPPAGPELTPPGWSSRVTSPEIEAPSPSSTTSDRLSGVARVNKLRSLLTASTNELNEDTARTTSEMVQSLLIVGGYGLNQRREKRTQSESTRWLLAPSEASDLGNAVGNIVGRRTPEGIAGPDAADVATILATSVTYTMRQVTGISPAEYEHQVAAAARASATLNVDPHGGLLDNA